MTGAYTSELGAWSAIVGMLLPIVIAMISQSGWGTRARSVLTAAISLVAAVGTVYYTNPGGIETGPLVITVATILTLAGSTYRTFWKPTGIAGAVNKATNL